MATKKLSLPKNIREPNGKLIPIRAPEKPPKSLRAFIVERCKNEVPQNILEVLDSPCLHCFGAQRIYDPNDEPDPIEGNKLRRRITCPTCQGTRKGNIKVWQNSYRAHKEKYQKTYDQLADKINSLQRVLDKIKPADWEKISGVIYINTQYLG